MFQEDIIIFYLLDHENRQKKKKKSNPMDFKCGLIIMGNDSFYVQCICAKQTHRISTYLGMYGKNLGLGFRLCIDVCAVTCNIWQASLYLFFRSHGDTRVRMFFTVLQSNIFERYKIQVEVTSVKHLFKFYMELDGISSTSISSF